jgi:N-acyl-D-aspartate/D-glutamate deacylase
MDLLIRNGRLVDGLRGVVAPGRRADPNVIDLERLTLHLPEIAHDLPTGARPGRLVRGPHPAAG